MKKVSQHRWKKILSTFTIGFGCAFVVAPSFAEPIYMNDTDALFKLRYAQFPMQDASAPNEFTTGDAVPMPRRTLTPKAPVVSTNFTTNPCSERDILLREAQDGGDPYLWSPLNASTISATGPNNSTVSGIGYAPGASNASDCWGVVKRGVIPAQEVVADLVTDDIPTPIQTDDVPSFIPASLITPRGITPSSGGRTIIVTNNDCVFTTDENGNISCSTTTPPEPLPPSSSGITPPTSSGVTPPTSSGITPPTSSGTTTPPTSSGTTTPPPPTSSGVTSSGGIVPPTPVSEPAPLALLLGAGLFAYMKRKRHKS